MSETVDNCESTPWEGRAILHVDLDAFFAAVEQLDHPEWRGKPVIVGGDSRSRGVVSTCSYEARVFGVHSAMPSSQAERLCPQAIWAPCRFARYHEISLAVRAIFAEETPLVQPVSIDEAYLDVTPGRHLSEHPVAIARRIRSKVAALGITCSVGISAVKSVAKIASDYHKPDGLTVVCPGHEREFLAPLPLRALPGLGPKTARRLEGLGIRTLADLAGLDDLTTIEVLGAHGSALVVRARGRDSRDVHENDGVKSLSSEHTFATDVRSLEDIQDALHALTAKVGRRLRRKGLAGRTITVKLRFSDFTTKTVRRTLPVPTDDESCFMPVARELLASAWSPGIGLRLLGVGLSGFDEKATQLNLLEGLGHSATADEASPRPERLVRSIDSVRDKFGEKAIRFGRDMRTHSAAEDPSEDA
ncbi:MAG: DNA polymerase IV [Coriobacteriia bacterium]|nr:DNA polymerase IV [Coriobacteriia bacterium]